MSYQDISIKKIVSMIGNNEVYLPAIQRKFVWSHEQIERFFDSIMLGYPIGTFLFWSVEKKQTDDYTFYKFIQNYHERDNSQNEKAPKPEMKERIIGVLDGQQRLSSLYLALQGSYAYKKPRARWDNDDAFPIRQLCFNILKDNKVDEGDVTYAFRFLTEAEQKEVTDSIFWLPVKTALEWDDATDYIMYATRNNLLSNGTAIKNLTLLWQRITKDQVINYFEVQNNSLDDILDIFIRVNSGGTVLSKSDLLFSTIVANWEDGRDEVESLLKSLNKKGDGFNFDNDFVMRACLVLTDSPVLFNVKNFRSSTVLKIRDNWEKIKNSLIQTVELLVEFGFNKENLLSKNSIIPIAYHILKGGNVNESDKRDIRKYLIASLLKQIFGGKGDQVLESIRNFVREKQGDDYQLKMNDFSFKDLQKMKLPADKSFVFDEDDLNHIFDFKKGTYTFMVLSLLYPHLKLNQVKFHQDHIHPFSIFRKRTFKELGLSSDQQERWSNIRDTLPNLQLLEGGENMSKNKMPFKDWVSDKDNVRDFEHYRVINYIPNTDLDISNFEQFYEMRKQMIKENFKNIML